MTEISKSSYLQAVVSSRLQEEEKYWLTKFAGAWEKCVFPYDKKSSQNEYLPEPVEFEWTGDIFTKLLKLRNDSDYRLQMILTAVLVVLLNKYTAAKDIITGTPVLKQDYGAEFSNTVLALRIIIEHDAVTFKDLLLQVRQAIVEANENQNYPVERLLYRLGVNYSSPGDFPLFDAALLLENIQDQQYLGHIRVNMIFSFLRTGASIKGRVIYNSALYEKETVIRIVGCFTGLLTQILQNVDVKIGEIEPTGEEEKKQILLDFNNTDKELSGPQTIHGLAAAQVEKTPGHIALVYSSIHITYRELDILAGRLAFLLSEKGISPDTIAAIIMARSVEMIIAILGVLKAGGAYLPIEPGYPQERIAYMLKDSSAKLLAGANELEVEKLRRWEGEKILHHSSFIIHHSKELAYIIYTSGSTGKPKGAAIEHRSAVNTLLCRKEEYQMTPDAVSLQLFSYAFDGFVTSFFTPLISGAKIIIPTEEAINNVEKLRKIIVNNQVSHFISTPGFYCALLDYLSPADTRSWRVIALAGDILTGDVIAASLRKNPALEIAHEYGVTEAAVMSTICRNQEKRNKITIGTPIWNTRIYILNEAKRLQPVGIPGELCIAGHSLARGYLNNPELTAEKFSFNRSYKTYILYRSGDLARWLSDGNIEFLGRIDFQVKIRGYRIELNEIENLLARHHDSKAAVVTAREGENGTKFLCAYIVEKTAPNNTFSPAKYRTYLKDRLPVYMIPTYFVNLDSIPLTPTGKIDRNALPDPLRLTNDNTEAAPGSEMEKKLAVIWQNVLGRETIGINENFFLIGGDSIKSIQILSRINQAGYKIEMKELFEYPTIAKLAPKIKPFANTSEQITVTGRVPLTPVQAWFFDKFHTAIHHFNQSVMFYARDGFDEKKIKAIFTKIQEHHDALRMTYKKGNGEIIQINHGLDYPLSLTSIDFRGGLNVNAAGKTEDEITAITGQANLIQAGINLETGPLMKLGLFHLDDGDRLLIVIHHLAADGISWRILFEDLETLFRQHRNKEPLSLPLKTDAFKTWAEKLRVYADSDAFLKEKTYWAELESLEIPVIERDFPVTGNHRRDEGALSFRLNEKETDALLTKANNAFGTEITDILLAALAAAIKKTWGHDRTAVALEGHGREEIMPGLDITRTFGWFTTGYPVVLNASHENDPAQLLKEIKETTRKIPHKGIGYGILKYLTSPGNKKDILFKLHPQIGFNYLGQFDADLKRLPFEIAQESSGETIAPDCERELDFEISGMIANNGLVISLGYNQKHYKKETVETLLDHYHSQLKNLVDFCVSKQKREWTPSDFTYNGLSIEMVDKLCGRYNLEDIYLLTPMQEGMLFHALYDGTSASYFEQSSYRLQGELDPVIVTKSLNELCRRHDILRTAFIHDLPGRPVQLVLKDRPCDFHYQDIRNIEKREARESFVSAFKAADKKKGFNLSQDILMRVALFRLDEAEYEFTWSFHHILMDGWCIGILNSEFFEIYTAYIENRPHRLTPLKPYRNYIQWLEKQDREASAQYWKNYLDSFAGQTGVPQAKIRKQEARELQYKDETYSIVLDSVKTAGLQRLAAVNHVTLNILTQAVWGILLGKYNTKEDVVFGAVVSGRPFELEGVESMVGLFINTIPVRVRFDPVMKFQELLEITQAEAVVGERHHYHPLAEIQASSSLKQNLIDHIFVFENYPIIDQLERKSNHFLKITNADVFEQTNYDFNIILAGSGRLSITFKYNAHTYDRDFIEQLAGHFRHGLDQVSENAGLSIGELEFLAEAEKKLLLYSFNDAAAAGYPRGKTIHQLFGEQVARTPDHIAVVSLLQTTYRQLDNQSNCLAGLLSEKGIQAGHIAALMIERSLEMIMGILGILKSGAAYLPIDPGYPQERIAYMLKDSGAKLLAGANELEGEKVRRWEVEKVLHHSSFDLPRIHHSKLAYIIYTSGTTGRPKGVMIEHYNVVRLFFNDRCLFDFNCTDVWSMFHSYCFDFSVWEMYGALFFGGKLVIIPQIVARDPQAFREVLYRNGVTVLNQTPSAFYNLINEELKYTNRVFHLRYVIFGGEALAPGKLKQWREKYPYIKLINMFGITETTVHVTYKEITAEEIEAGISCIGKPIPTLSVYLFDGRLKLLPAGVTGELYIGGSGVGRGYLNRPELSQEKFIGNPYQTNERLYKSGDLARLSVHGELEYRGRIDRQVQVHGYRVEAGEIESRLLKHEDIQDAVVTANRDNEDHTFLTAYIVSRDGRGGSQLREYLASTLPAYMIPAYFVPIPRIPLTANGKIDVGKLPLPGGTGGEEYTAARDHIEQALVEAWREVLALDKISIHDNFFNTGGDSIKALRLLNAVNNRLQTHIKLLDIFTHSTPAELAGALRKGTAVSQDEALAEAEKEIAAFKTRITASAQAQAQTPLPADVEDIFPMSDIEKGMVFYSAKSPDKAVYYDQFVYIRQYRDFNPGLFQEALELMTARHENLRTSYNTADFDGFVHFIHRAVPAAYQHFDIAGLGEGDREKYIVNYMVEDRKRKKQTGTPPLWRMATFDLGGGQVCAVWSFHHAILDGWSNASLMTELNNTYLNLKAGKKESPGQLKITYKDFVAREMAAKKKAPLIDYWKLELQDYKRIAFTGGKRSEAEEAKEIVDFLPPDNAPLNEMLIKAAKQYHTSVKNLCFSAYLYMLNMLTYDNDIVAGLISHNRPEAEDGDKLIGCFLNTLPVRINIPAETTCEAYIYLVDSKLLQLKQYEKITFYEIVRIIGEKNYAGNPILDTIFNYVDFHIYRQAAADVLPIDTQAVKRNREVPPGYERANTLFDFIVSPYAAGAGGISILMRYAVSIIDAVMVQKLYSYFETILERLVSQPKAVLTKTEILSAGEKQDLLYRFNDTGAAYPAEKTIDRLFIEQAGKNLNHVGLAGPVGQVGQVSLTYREINVRSNGLAGVLTAKGVGPGSIAAIMADPAIEMIMALLAILKAGAAYLPIDPGYPQERIDYMLKDSSAKLLINEKFFGGSRRGAVFQKSPPAAANLAYIIYTSGSTGRPKGVMVEHRNVVRLVMNPGFIDWRESQHLLMTGAPVFDISTFEIWGPLLHGLTLYRVEKDIIMNPVKLSKNVIKWGINVLHLIPQLFNRVLEEAPGTFAGLEYFLVGGDLVNPGPVNRLREMAPHLKIIHCYGPTENTTFSTTFRVEKDYAERIPIGKPIANSSVYIFDRYGHMLPVGVIGEIVVGGAGVARGYLNNPELTAERFNRSYRIHRTYISYRTGDLGRWLANGNIEFLGRVDQQVKIRGHRVELAEIEARLAKHPQIKQALLITKEGINPGERHLVGYIVGTGTGNINIPGLKSYLGTGLPGYMIPAYFVQLEKFPLTANGKIDIRALPEPAVVPGRNYIAPGNELEEKLVNMWKEILGKDGQVGVDDNFFELGGNSLSLMQLASKINKTFKVEIPVSRLFKETSIREIARSIHRNDFEDHLTGPYFIFNPGQEKVLYCFPSQLAYGIVYRDLAAYLTDTVLYSFNFIESKDRCREYCQLITRHQEHGPYILFGYSGGGILIFEIAKELERQGYEVGSLIFLDIAVDLKKRLAGTVNESDQSEEGPGDFDAKVLNTLAEMGLSYLNDEVQAKLKSYHNYILSREYQGKIKAGIHHILAQDRIENESADLRKYTSGVYRTYRGFGTHRDMLSGGNIEKNAALIREILISARTQQL